MCKAVCFASELTLAVTAHAGSTVPGTRSVKGRMRKPSYQSPRQVLRFTSYFCSVGFAKVSAVTSVRMQEALQLHPNYVQQEAGQRALKPLLL